MESEVTIRCIINNRVVDAGELTKIAGWSVALASRREVTRAQQVLRAPLKPDLGAVAEALRDVGRSGDWISDQHIQTIAERSGSPITFLRRTIRNVNAWMAGIDEFITQFGEPYGAAAIRSGDTLHTPGLPTFVVLAGDSTSLGPWTLAQAMLAGVRVAAKPSNAEPLTSFLFAKALSERGVAAPNLLFLNSSDQEHRGWIGDLLKTAKQAVLYGHDESIATVHRSVGYIPGYSWFEYFSGRSGAIILPDADLRAAASALVRGTTVDRGNVCIATKWVVAPKGAREALESHLLQSLRDEVVHRDPLDEATTLGRLDPEGRKIALAAGYGGEILFEEHAILARVDDSSPMLTSEIPYPVLGIRYYDESSEDPVAIANRTAQHAPTQLSLVISVFTEAEETWIDVAPRLRAFRVYRNRATSEFSYYRPHQGRHLCLGLMRPTAVR